MYPLRTHPGGLGLALLIAVTFFSQACTVSDSAVYAAKEDSAEADVLAVVGVPRSPKRKWPELRQGSYSASIANVTRSWKIASTA